MGSGRERNRGGVGGDRVLFFLGVPVVLKCTNFVFSCMYCHL